MYIQITTRCNMTCEHCCMACTAEGEDMSLETYRNALNFDDTAAIGGGEPTLHPMFWQFLGEAIAMSDHVWLATNGSQTEIALALAKMAKKGVIGCALSQDIYHDPIDDRVVQAFTREHKMTVYHSAVDNDCREIRNVTGNEVNGGRCDFGRDNACACSDLHVSPDGTLRVCGCEEATVLGNVNDGKLNLPEWYVSGECYKDQNKQLI